MKIHSVEAELFRVDGWTHGEVKKPQVSCCNFAKAHKKCTFPTKW